MEFFPKCFHNKTGKGYQLLKYVWTFCEQQTLYTLQWWRTPGGETRKYAVGKLKIPSVLKYLDFFNDAVLI